MTIFTRPRGRAIHTFLLVSLLGSTFLSGSALAQTSPDTAKLLERLEQLENRLNALETENKELTEKLEFRTERLENVENRVAKAAQPGVVPTFSDVNGNFTFKVRGVVDADTVVFNERRGGYDYNNGTAFRRARLGFEGTAFKDWGWRMEADFSGNQVTVLDAYIQYNGIKPWSFTLGQHKAPFSLESNNSDSFNTFIERGMFTNAFGAAGAERRIGASAAYAKDNWTVTIGLFGDGEAANRSNAGPDESWGFNGRATWELINEPGRILHLGAAGYWRTDLKTAPTGTATTGVARSVRLTERPNIRVDGGNIADTGVIPNVTDLYYGGVELAGVLGPVSLVSEYGHLEAERTVGLRNVSFDGFYVYGSWFLTGESRTFRNGIFDRIRPLNNLTRKGDGWGAFELALRYDYLDLSDTPVVGRVGNKAQSTTVALNWYWNPNIKVQTNWVRFWGDNTPLDPIGSRTAGDAFATRLHIDW